MNNKIVLTAKGIQFYSQNDEDAFFEWLDKIKCIQGYRGEGDTLNIEVNRNKVTNSSLREILALFARYKIDMKQLAIFRTTKNQEWFCDSKKYWYALVFGN